MLITMPLPQGRLLEKASLGNMTSAREKPNQRFPKETAQPDKPTQHSPLTNPTLLKASSQYFNVPLVNVNGQPRTTR